MRTITAVVFSVVLLAAAMPLAAQVAQGTAFTYQGELRQNNLPVTGSVDMVFTLYDAATSGTVIGAPITLSAATSNPVQVSEGTFAVTLDFGGPSFITSVDDARWLEVKVAGNVLSPRTKIENSPYALTSQLAYGVLAGSIGSVQINSAQVQRRVTGSCGSGSSISVINQDGTVACQAAGSGTITAVAPASGSGLTGGGTSGSVSLGTDLNVLQKRVGGTCPSGFGINTINADGTVACQAVGTGTVTSITAGNGLLGGTITSSGTIDVDSSVVALKSNTWSTNGNASVGTGFLGTTDSTAITFKANNLRVGLLQPTSPPAGYADAPNVVLGSSINSAGSAVGATVSGGGTSFCNPTPCTPTPRPNVVSGDFGTVGGGWENTSGGTATISGGVANAAGVGATVGGGNANTASGTYSSIGGGQVNTASGFGATVPGGIANSAAANYSLAAGAAAKVRSAADIGGGNTTGDAGTFVWSDSSGTTSLPFDYFTSNGTNQFLVRAGGGVAINGAPFTPDVELTIHGSALSGTGNNTADVVLIPRGSPSGFDIAAPGDGTFDVYNAAGGFVSSLLTLSSAGNFTLYGTTGGVTTATLNLDNSGNLTIFGTAGSNTTNAIKPGGGSWAAPSDARLKRDIQPLDHMLDRLLQLRGVTFEYAQPDEGLHPPGRHTGFIAQQVQQIFPDWVGQTSDGYLAVGPKGFEAMTVEALRELRAEKDGELAELRSEKDTEIAELRGRLDKLSARMDRLQQRSASIGRQQ